MKNLQFSQTIVAVRRFDRAKFNWANTEFPMDSDVTGFLWARVKLAVRRVQEMFAYENVVGSLIEVDPESEKFRRFLGIESEVV
jgi:hypothetical protein